MVLITHDPDDLVHCAELVVVLREGRVVQKATEVASFSIPAACRAAVAL